MAPSEGVEPSPAGFEARCTVHYATRGCPLGEIRTHVGAFAGLLLFQTRDEGIADAEDASDEN